MRTAAILPVKRFASAKQRLAPSIPDGSRATLARAMVSDVLAALAATPAIELTIVVTDEPDAASAARALGAVVLPDTAAAGQSAAVALGVRKAIEDGFARVLCVPGDCPALDPAELDEMLGRELPEVVIVPDRHGTGTNGLLMHPPDAIAPSFGPDSCERHRALARAAGRGCAVERAASLLLDVDTGADLRTLREHLALGDAAARSTRTVLCGDDSLAASTAA